MEALAWDAVATLGAVLYLYRGWTHGRPLLSETCPYGIARAESRDGSHLDLAFGEDGDEVACLNCGAENEGRFSFCRRCETTLC